MSPPAIGFVTNLGVGMGEFDCCCCSAVGPGRILAPSTIWSWCCTAVAAADVGCAVIGMKRLCLDPTVLGDCWGGSVSICLPHFSYYRTFLQLWDGIIRDITNCGQTLEINIVEWATH